MQNCVKEIWHNVHPDLWNHCPGETNPACLPSRGISIMELSVSQLWRAGPKWLILDTPTFFDSTPTLMPELCVSELKAGDKFSHTLLAVEKVSAIGELISWKDFSSFIGSLESLHMSCEQWTTSRQKEVSLTFVNNRYPSRNCYCQEALDQPYAKGASPPQGFWWPEKSIWSISRWQRITEMWWSTTECCYSNFCWLEDTPSLHS